MLSAWLLSTPALAAAQEALSRPNWDESLAVQTAEVPDSHARLETLFSLLESGKRGQLEPSLERVISGVGLSAPARDFILFHFAAGLADYPAVDPQIVERLRTVEPMVMVPHPERDSLGVPLYNIAAAAQGVQHLGHRRRARSEATTALADSPERWLNAYLSEPGNARMGYIDALDEAPGPALVGLIDAAAARPDVAVELTPVVGKSALLLGDRQALRYVVKNGGGSDLARILEAAGRTLPPGDSLALLAFAVAEAPPANASLAMAQLYPALAEDPAARNLMLSTLGHADLGAAAAIILASRGGPEARALLRAVADGQDGLAAQRARSALALGPSQGGSR